MPELTGAARVSSATDSLNGKRALITGAASGIGLATVAAFLERGASVAALDRNRAALAAAIGALAGPVRPYVADISNPDESAAVVHEAVQWLAGLDLLVNCAGVSSVDQPVRLAETSDRTWQGALSVNLTGTFLMMRAALPYLVQSGGGAIVNLASTYAVVAGPLFAAYAASKAGIVELTKTVAVEYAPEGVRANAVAPGFVDTPMLRADIQREPDPQAAESAILARIPQNRLMSAEEVARVIAFLACDDAAVVTGTLVVADGGFTAV